MIQLLLLAFCQLSLPTEVKGQVGGFVAITAQTEGKAVRFVALDAGLNVFPSELLADKKATVVSAALPGKYRLLAYTSLNDLPSVPVIVLVTIGQTPEPGPGPKPKPDELATSLRSILGGLQEQGQADQVAKLIQFYRDAEAVTADITIKTTDGLHQALGQKRKLAGIRDNALLSVRERLAEEWAAAMGTADVPLTAELRAKAAALCARIATALEAAQ